MMSLRVNCFRCLAIIAALAVCVQARADLVYSVGVSGPTSAGIGSVFHATIYLQEEVTGASTPILGDAALGIVQGNFRIDRTAGTSVDITGVNLNPDFDNGGGAGTSFFDADEASGTQFTIGPLAGTETSPGSGIYRLALASVTFTVVALGGDTTFQLADFDGATDDLVLFDGSPGGLVLDDVIPDPVGAGGIRGDGFGDFTVSSVPEPTTMGALGAFGAIGAAISYFRRRKQTAASPKAA
jgi:hypothetical protein